MQEPAGPKPPVAAVLQPRRRRSRAVFVLVAIACVLAGRGLGWFGGGGEAAPGPSPPAAAAPHEVRAAAPAGAAATATAAAAAAAPAAPAIESVPAAAPPAPVTSEATPVPPAVTRPATVGIDGDRFASLLSLVLARQQQGELGGALAALQRAQALPLDAAQRDTLAATAREVRVALDGACQQIVAALGKGEVLAAHSTSRALLAEGAELARPVLAASLNLAEPSLERAPERDALPWPIAAPLARDRVVRARLADGPVTGRVVDGRSDQVTLRVETPHGVTFPTLAVTACEPVDPSAAEAVELALAALQAGEPLLARLWLCCADQRGDTSSPRARRLQEILR